jgi:hypothetical protein
MIHISFPPVCHILDFWHEIEPLLELAIDKSNGELDMQSIKSRIDEKKIALCTIFDTDQKKLIAVLTFDMFTFDTGMKVLNIQCAGGERLDEWIDQVDEIANSMAKRHNCNKIYIIGRNGWARKLRERKYEHAHTVLSREVD